MRRENSNMTRNHVFIATSSDGYIAKNDGNIEWLQNFPIPKGNDLGYQSFIAKMDAILMGRKTFEQVLSFEIEWPYPIPVFVLTNTLTNLPEILKQRVHLIRGSIESIQMDISNQGYQNIYIDGANTIQQFLAVQAIDEMTITKIPLELGEGIPLFQDNMQLLNFTCISTKIESNGIIQSYYCKNQGL